MYQTALGLNSLWAGQAMIHLELTNWLFHRMLMFLTSMVQKKKWTQQSMHFYY